MSRTNPNVKFCFIKKSPPEEFIRKNLSTSMCRMQFTRCIEFAEIRGSNTTPSREQTKRHHELKKAQLLYH